MKRRKYYRHKRNTNKDDNSIRLLILSFLILLAVIFKTVTGVSTVTVLKEFSSAVIGERSYSEVISTIGKAISDGAKENAAAVFRKDDTDTFDSGDEGYVLPVVTERTKETEETTKGRELVPAFNKEVKITQIEFVENEDEYLDETENEPFEIPAPSNTDNGKYELSFKYIRPCGGRITSPFGYRIHPISGETTFHYGIDIAAAKGDEIYAFADGKISEKGKSSIFGKYIKIEHKNGFASFYAHLDDHLAKKGESVNMGEVIGKAGETGIATGPHLHFEVRKDGKVIDPEQYIQ